MAKLLVFEAIYGGSHNHLLDRILDDVWLTEHTQEFAFTSLHRRQWSQRTRQMSSWLFHTLSTSSIFRHTAYTLILLAYKWSEIRYIRGYISVTLRHKWFLFLASRRWRTQHDLSWADDAHPWRARASHFRFILASTRFFFCRFWCNWPVASCRCRRPNAYAQWLQIKT